MLLPASGEYAVSELIAGAPVASQLQDGQLLLQLSVDGKSTRLLRIATASTSETRQVHLRAGWNLIGLPGAPVSSRLSDLVAPVAGSIDRLYAFDASAQRWLVYALQQPEAGELQTVA